MSAHFVWSNVNFTCGTCGFIVVLDRRSYEKEILVRTIIYCRNENCDRFRLPYELDTEQLKITATPYGPAANKSKTGAAAGPDQSPAPDSGRD